MSIQIQTKAIPMAFCNQAYSFAMEVKVSPQREVTWRINKETPLPWGLQLNDKGQISGIPSTVQQVSVQFYASAQDPEETDTCILNIKVYRQLAILNEKCWEAPILAFQDIVLSAEGGVEPYQWTCDSLPIGLKLEKNIITGKPQASGGMTPVSVTVKDNAGNTAEGEFQLRITRK